MTPFSRSRQRFLEKSGWPPRSHDVSCAVDCAALVLTDTRSSKAEIDGCRLRKRPATQDSLSQSDAARLEDPVLCTVLQNRRAMFSRRAHTPPPPNTFANMQPPRGASAFADDTFVYCRKGLDFNSATIAQVCRLPCVLLCYRDRMSCVCVVSVEVFWSTCSHPPV